MTPPSSSYSVRRMSACANESRPRRSTGASSRAVTERSRSSPTSSRDIPTTGAIASAGKLAPITAATPSTWFACGPSRATRLSTTSRTPGRHLGRLLDGPQRLLQEERVPAGQLAQPLGEAGAGAAPL